MLGSKRPDGRGDCGACGTGRIYRDRGPSMRVTSTMAPGSAFGKTRPTADARLRDSSTMNPIQLFKRLSGA
jgi:hypothetical protein